MASKSKRRRKVLGASCILAALIIAGSSFAWFTSKDEVTNRLTAQADYGVSIVESFAPPENWIPGQNINKDVYAVNTGSIGAFVKETVTSKFSITKEVPVTVTQNQTSSKNNGTINSMQYATADDTVLADCIELDYDEIYVTEAGAYLAYVPNGSTQAPGRLIVAYNPNNVTPTYKYVATDSGTTYYMTEAQYADATSSSPTWPTSIPSTLQNAASWSKVEVPADKTDFTPDAEGLYVFRRVVNVDSRNGETFEYEAYYYKDGHYYKVKNLAVTPDNVQDFSNDEIYTDGIIDSATFDLVKEVKEVVVPTLTYDQANNRLVATYGSYADNAQNNIIGTTGSTDLAKLAEDLDKAEHEWVEARAALDAALSEKATSDSNVARDQAAIAALEAELASVQARITELEGLIGDDGSGLKKRVNDQDILANTTDKNDLESKLGTLYGDSNNNKYDYSLDGNDANDRISFVESSTDTTSTTTAVDGSKYYEYLEAKKDYEAAKTAYGADAYTAYLADLRAKFGGSSGKLASLPANATLDDAIALLTYDDLKDVPYDGTDGKHLLNQKAVALLKAELEYNQAKTAAQDAYNKYKNDMILLGNGKVDTTGTPATTEHVGGYDIDYTKYGTINDDSASPAATNIDYVSGMRKELADLTAEKQTLTSKKDALDSKLNTAYNQAVTDATFGTSSHTAAENLTAATDAYNSAYNAYIAAQNAYNKRKAEYDAAKNLKIYINLKDVVTAGGIKDKWQIVPIDTENLNTETINKDTASFYYTSILPSGETSAMLIDSVKLAEEVTQDMYKSFDFDIDVKLDSRQVAYKEGDPTELETAQLADFGANVTFDDKHNEGTALTWAQ